MRKRVLIIDTSILCVWLEVFRTKTSGSAGDTWDKQRVEAKLAEESKKKTTFVLPLATIIETGNHIAQANQCRRELGTALADLMRKSADNESPWAAFSDQDVLWSADKLRDLAETWPTLAASKLSLGDATIKAVVEHYAQSGYEVEILTGDRGLKAYQPAAPLAVPRRRRER